MTMRSSALSLVTPVRVVVLATILTAVLASWDLGARSLWLDEAYTVEIAGRSWAHLWERVTTREAAMAFYYVLVHGWLTLGRDEATLRAFSALIAVASIPLVYWTGVRLVGPVAAATGVLLLSMHAFFLRYGQEARAYTLVMLLAVASALALLRAAERRALRDWALWVLCAVLLVYSHPLAILVVGAQVVAMWPRASIRVLAPGAAAVAVLVAPMVWYVFARDDGHVSWVPPPDRWGVEVIVGRLTATENRIGIFVYGLCALAALWRGGFGTRFLFAWAALPFLALLVVSMVKPLLVDRYLLMTVPAIVLLAGAGLAAIPSPGLRGLSVAALLALQAMVVPRMLAAPSGEDWRGAATIIRGELRSGDASACWASFTCVSFEYYFAPPVGGPPIVPLAAAVDDPAAMAAITKAHPRLWLAVSHADMLPDRIEMLTRIEAMLAESYVLADRRELDGISLRRYERVPSATNE